MTEDFEDFVDSGPFCVHYSEFGDCDEKCAKCGHTCNQHSGGYPENECNVAGCDCPEFVDIKE